MSAANFYNANASKIFMVSCVDEWDYDDTKENVLSDLETKGWRGVFQSDRQRHYPGHIFAEKWKEVRIGKYSAYVTVRAIIRSGYFADANLDWDIEVDDTEYSFEYYGKSEALENLESSHEYGNNPGFCKMQAKNLLKKVERAISELSDELEAVYSKYTDELVCVGRFSNGEAVYERASSLRGMLNAV